MLGIHRAFPSAVLVLLAANTRFQLLNYPLPTLLGGLKYFTYWVLKLRECKVVLAGGLPDVSRLRVPCESVKAEYLAYGP